MTLTTRDRRVWQTARWSFWGLIALAWLAVVAAPLLWEPGSDPAFVGAVGLLIAVIVTPWAWLPVSVLPSLLTAVEGTRLRVPTYRRVVHIDLEAVTAIDARTLPGRPSPIPFVSLRDRHGERVVLLWESLDDEVETAIQRALHRAPQVTVSRRAAAMLGLDDAPRLVERVGLSLQTGAFYVGAICLLMIVIVRLYGGFWFWDVWAG